MKPLLAAFLLTLASCTFVVDRTSPAVAGDAKATSNFCGIDHSLAKNKTARVLIIHGMGWHESHDYDLDFRERLRTSLGMEPIGCAGPYPIVNPKDPLNVYGGVLRCTFVRTSDSARVRIYNLLWSPLTMPYKVAELGYDSERPYHGRRARFNRALKKELIDRSLSDAVLYAGQLGENMRYSVQQAICSAVTDQVDLSQPCGQGYATPSIAAAGGLGRETPDLFVVTHSLGSVMLLETLGGMKGAGETAAASSLLQHVQLIAMMANQLPLLRLASLNQPPEDGALGRGAPTLEPLFGARKEPIKVAAFTDINDLLSYPVPETWKTVLYPELQDRFTFINYPVTNARSVTLGMLANPATAHTGYWSNSQVIEAIAHGHRCE